MAYYMNVTDAAELLDVAYRTMLSWIASGRLGKVKITAAKRYRVSWENIQYFCAENDYPLPEKIPIRKKKSKSEWVSVDSEEGKELLKK